MEGPATSNDVARLAGVAQSTVSYVLTGKGRVSEETRRRVLRAAEELNYQPNAGAKALRSRRSRVIGLMFPVHAAGSQPARLRFLTDVVSACREQGYDALVVTADEGAEGLRRLAGTALCDGLLVLEVKDREPLAEVSHELRIPTLFVGIPTRHDSIICVARDYTRAAELCVEHLASQGRRRLRLLTPSASYLTSLNFHRRFVRGARAAAERHGIELTEQPVRPAFLDLHADTGAMLDAGTALDGIICSPEVQPANVTSSLLLHGVNPGTDVSVVGIGEHEGDTEGPDGTTISLALLSGTELARRSVTRLLDLVEGRPQALAPGALDLLEPEWRAGTT